MSCLKNIENIFVYETETLILIIRFVDFQMAVLPVQTEAVVFSIDGSFAANISFSGTDPKVRAGAVDVRTFFWLLLVMTSFKLNCLLTANKS